MYDYTYYKVDTEMVDGELAYKGGISPALGWHLSTMYMLLLDLDARIWKTEKITHCNLGYNIFLDAVNFGDNPPDALLYEDWSAHCD